MSLIEYIDHYFEDTFDYMDEFKDELKEKEYETSSWFNVDNIVLHYKNEIIYSIDKLEIHIRALRDKLEHEQRN